MRKYQLIVCVFISLLLSAGILFSQISETEARKDIQALFSVSDYIYAALSEEYAALKQKLKNNPDPYIDVVEQDLYLPTDINVLCEEDSLGDYSGFIRLLFFLGTDQAKQILNQEYIKQTSLLKSLREQAEYAEKNMSYDEYEKIDFAHSTLLHLQIYFIADALGYYDRAYIQDCLNRIDSVNTSLQANMVQYFLAVAPEDPQVALKIRQMYTTPGSIICNSEFYFEQYDYQYSDNPGTILDQMIGYIEKASGAGDINHRGIANSLTQKLEHARTQFRKNKIKQAANQLNAFLNELEAQKENHVSEQAYDLLKYNAEYLIARLEE